MENLKSIFEPLRKYGPGSGRAQLLPLDEAANRALTDQGLQKALEQELLSALGWAGSDVAKEYLCAKLARIGSESCVPVVSKFLGDEHLSQAARSTLEAVGGKGAAKALRQKITHSSGMELLGVIASLGNMRDKGSTKALGKLLAGGDPAVSAAAASALGKIGTTASAKLLQSFSTAVPAGNQRGLADAMLECSERLDSNGRNHDAASLRSHAKERLRLSAQRGSD